MVKNSLVTNSFWKLVDKTKKNQSHVLSFTYKLFQGNQMFDEGMFSFVEQYQLINAEEMGELENNH